MSRTSEALLFFAILVAFHLAVHLWPVWMFLMIAAVRIHLRNKEIREKLKAAREP
jgi:hypothetical protein